jgi:hypothetical protein
MSSSLAALAVMEYEPSASVNTPTPSPETTTATPGNPSPDARSVTLPVTLPWDHAAPLNSTAAINNNLAFIYTGFKISFMLGHIRPHKYDQKTLKIYNLFMRVIPNPPLENSLTYWK